MSKHGLGRGMDALLGETGGEEAAPEKSAAEEKDLFASGGAETSVSLDKLTANPDQPRKHFDEESLKELADSIKEHGVIQPVIAESRGDGTFLIIAGERRFRAAAIAGLREIPVIVRSCPGAKRLEISLIENVQRQDLDPVEEAAAYKALMDLTGSSQEEIAARVGKKRSTVANALRLLRLPEEMRQSLSGGEISPGHARAILAAEGKDAQTRLFREIREQGLSVREAEKRAAPEPGGGAKPEKPRGKARPPELSEMETKFLGKLGTKVTIDGDLNKGVIKIDYYSMEDLDRLYGILG